MKYKVTNKLESPIKFKGIIFNPKETKILDESPTSDRFHIEKIKELEKPEKEIIKGGKKE